MELGWCLDDCEKDVTVDLAILTSWDRDRKEQGRRAAQPWASIEDMQREPCR